MSYKLIRVDPDTVILDGRGLGLIGTMGGPQAHIACMRSINKEIFVGSRKYLVPNQTRALVQKHVKL